MPLSLNISTVPYKRWSFYDPSDGTTVSLDTNPITITRDRPTKQMTSVVTQQGPAVHETGLAPIDWAFTGFLYTKTSRTTLAALCAKRGPFQLTDHLGRVLLVKLLGLNAVRARTRNYPDRHTYEVKALFYGFISGG